MRIRFLTLLSALFALIMTPSLSLASHGGPHSLAGYVISAISHDETAPLVRNQAAIQAMVQNVLETETLAPDVATKLKVLAAYSDDNYAAATSLLIPLAWSLQFDWLPTHVTIHGAAASNNEMLLMLQQHAAHRADVQTFIAHINGQMKFMLAPCYYSARTFNTSEPIELDWSKANPTIKTVMAVISLLAAMAIAFAMVIATRRRPQPRTTWF